MTIASQPDPPFPYAPILLLALGTFAVGTEGFMIAAILPGIAADVGVSVPAAGQLVTVFALTYGLSSPLLTALTGGLDRRRLLILSMAAFTAANIVAASAPGYWSLVAARVLLAVAAGLYVPSANALAAVIAPSAQRGRALAIVTGGISLAVALGVPLGAFVGNHFGWRTTFLGVAALAAIASIGLLLGLPRELGAMVPTTNLRERFAVMRRPAVLVALLVTTLWGVGGYTVYTYIAPYLAVAAGIAGPDIGYVLFLWGGAAFVGLFVGGHAADRLGSARVIALALPLLAAALGSLSLFAYLLPPTVALLPILVAVVAWGLTGWGFYPAQQARLIGIAGLKAAPVVLSLNASFMYLGFSLGAVTGSLTLARGGVADLGWVGGLCVLSALALYHGRRRAVGHVACDLAPATAGTR